MRDAFLATARRERYDAVALELHGAMATTELPDADGDLLTALRQTIGRDVPIGIGLDLHAHVTPAMLGAVDICIACKENPHSDVVECGERVMECLDAVLDGRLKPVLTMAKAPMVLPGGGGTGSGPLAALHSRARAMKAANPAIWDVSLYNVYPHADDAGMGQAVVVLSDGESAAARTGAEQLAGLFWQWRDRFKDDLLTIDEALDRIAACPAGRPYILADMGDRVLAGAPGDSTDILAKALARADHLHGAIPLTDPVGVAAAAEAGVGARVTLGVGGRMTPGFAPLTISGTVRELSDGRFRIAGPYGAGEEVSLGRTALIEVADRLSVILTSVPGWTHDPAAFTSQGIELPAQDFVVVKSGYHFALNFNGTGTPLYVATPGIGYYVPGCYARSRGRVWPDHDIGEPALDCCSFPASPHAVGHAAVSAKLID
jgi:microcystin degradation protein MlrC